MKREELREYLIRDRPLDYDIARNSSMLGSIVNIFDMPRPTRENVILTPHGRYLPTPEHGHSSYEMMYVYEGSITHVICGDRIILKAGSICLLDPSVKHSIEVTGKYDLGVNFLLAKSFFTPDFFAKMEDNSLFYEFFANTLYKPNAFGRYLVLHGEDNMLIRELAELAICEFFDPDLCTKSTIESLIPILLNEYFRVWRNAGGKKILNEPDGASNVWQILRHIRQNCATATLTTTAHRFGYAPNYLSTLLSKATGESFTDIRQKACLMQASLMLNGTDMAVGDIAQSVGFSNISFFYSLFHRHFGMTPAEYREKGKQGTIPD